MRGPGRSSSGGGGSLRSFSSGSASSPDSSSPERSSWDTSELALRSSPSALAAARTAPGRRLGPRMRRAATAVKISLTGPKFIIGASAPSAPGAQGAGQALSPRGSFLRQRRDLPGERLGLPTKLVEAGLQTPEGADRAEDLEDTHRDGRHQGCGHGSDREDHRTILVPAPARD